MNKKTKNIIKVFTVIVVAGIVIAIGMKNTYENKHNESKYVGIYNAVTYVDGVEDADLGKEFCLCLNAEDLGSICIDHVVHSGKWKETKTKVTIYDKTNGNVALEKEGEKLIYEDDNLNQKTYFTVE